MLGDWSAGKKKIHLVSEEVLKDYSWKSILTGLVVTHNQES